MSPGFPKRYPNSVDCTWFIQLSHGQLIEINLIHFDLAPDFW